MGTGESMMSFWGNQLWVQRSELVGTSCIIQGWGLEVGDWRLMMVNGWRQEGHLRRQNYCFCAVTLVKSRRGRRPKVVPESYTLHKGMPQRLQQLQQL